MKNIISSVNEYFYFYFAFYFGRVFSCFAAQNA